MRVNMKTIGVLLWMASAVPAGAATGFREEFLSQLDELQGKAVALAKAIPEEKYAWRPGEGVRSTSEVLLHIEVARAIVRADAPGCREGIG